MTARTWRAPQFEWLRAPSGPALGEALLALAVFALALAVYNATLTPSLSYESFDGNELATIPYQLGLAHMTGYPLYTWAGKLFTYLPIGDVAHRVNLMSAAGAAGSAALLFGIGLLVIRGDSRPGAVPASRPVVLFAAASGALLFAYSTAVWSQAVIAEVYAPNIFMMALTLFLLLLWARREEGRSAPREADAGSLGLFALFALAFGLSLGTHMSNLALAPAFVLFIVLTNWRVLLQPKLIAMGALGFALGVLQFAWLPYKAADINDALMARSAPDDLEGIYNYTLNAFPQFRWAFPWDAMPDRIVLYIGLALGNFRWMGAALALAGGWAMVFRHPKAFLFLVTAYLAEMVFFLQYGATDIDVFFIPAHFLVAIAAGYGVYFILEAAVGLVRRYGRAALVAPALVIVVAGVQPFVSLGRYWDDNDQSMNTGINDFYEVVFDRLPSDSVLVGRSGVFGYDMFYFRYVYDVRPDVAMPLAERYDAAEMMFDGPTFTTAAQTGAGGARFAGPGASNVLPSDAWYWPVLSAPTQREGDGNIAAMFFGGQLALYEVKEEPPQIFVTGVAPANRVGADLGDVTLAGYDLDSAEVDAGGTIHLTLYWEGNWTGNDVVSTQVGDTPYVESHQLGFGNATRYVQTVGQPPEGSLLVEEYDLVVLSSLEPGEHALRIRVSSGAFGQEAGDWLELGTLTVR